MVPDNVPLLEPLAVLDKSVRVAARELALHLAFDPIDRLGVFNDNIGEDWPVAAIEKLVAFPDVLNVSRVMDLVRLGSKQVVWMPDRESFSIETRERSRRENFRRISPDFDLVVLVIAFEKTFWIGKFVDEIGLKPTTADDGIAADKKTFRGTGDVLAKMSTEVAGFCVDGNTHYFLPVYSPNESAALITVAFEIESIPQSPGLKSRPPF